MHNKNRQKNRGIELVDERNEATFRQKDNIIHEKLPFLRTCVHETAFLELITLKVNLNISPLFLLQGEMSCKILDKCLGASYTDYPQN